MLQPPRFRPRPTHAITYFALTLALSACRRVEDGKTEPIFLAKRIEDASTPPEPDRAARQAIVVPDFSEVAADIAPSVVTVIATVQQPNGNRSKAVRGLGSGVLVSATGEILTNEHVIASATRVDIELSNRKRIPARIKLSEPLVDLALLQLEGDTGPLPAVRFEASPVRPGQWVMAVGQPFGLGNTVTVGVISGLGRDHDDLGRPDALDKNGFWSFIQSDASINIGNSGGPLVNASGRVVGIATAVRNDGQGLAFAVPAPMAQRFLNEARTFGRLRKPYLGLSVKHDTNPGPGPGMLVRVTKVESDTPGARAGFQQGDVVLAIGGRAVSRVSDVAYLAQVSGVARPLTFKIQRGDAEPIELNMTPDERDPGG